MLRCNRTAGARDKVYIVTELLCGGALPQRGLAVSPRALEAVLLT
jgi:hypothetical protein